MVHGDQKDLSPISMRALLTIRSSIGLCQLCASYGITNPNILFRLAGAGYRTRSRLYSTPRSRRWERLWVVSTKQPGTSQLPLEWWIGRGQPINPYLKGIIVDRLRKELKPKELRVVPEEVVFSAEREILERTVIHNWMKQWLKWCHWFFTLALSPNPSLAELVVLCPNVIVTRGWRPITVLERKYSRNSKYYWKCWVNYSGWKNSLFNGNSSNFCLFNTINSWISYYSSSSDKRRKVWS